MMNDMHYPTNDQIAELGWTAIEATMEKAKQMGLPWPACILGIDRAYSAVSKAVDILIFLGPEMVDALGQKMTEEMLKEAEEALND